MENENTKICLMVVYNHRYDKNISRIEEIYKGKFSHIFHIMPFYDGDKENVISVYENSFYFSGYIAQAYQHLKNKGFTHFFVVADDMILNPVINENSLWDETGIKKDECFISGFIEMHKLKHFWGHIISALHFRLNLSGTEFQNKIPTYENAETRFKKFGLECKPIPWKLFSKCKLKTIIRYLKDWPLKNEIKWPFKRKFEYPLIGAYSDIFIVTADTMKQFAHYCGIFASANLFVEIAIPTAMVLSANKIRVGENSLSQIYTTKIYGNNLKLKANVMWSPVEWTQFREKYNSSLNALLKNYPQDTFFLHPIKLSKWK